MTARPQPDLFDMKMTAIFGGINDCYRYELRRIWDDKLPLLVVCMLNPSTADHRQNDPTILTLIHFAKLWGYGGILVVNLYAFRASQPAVMAAAPEPIGEHNHDHCRAALRYASHNGGKALAAWGAPSAINPFALLQQVARFTREAEIWTVDLVCLGTTSNGAPKHPMARGLHRIPRDQQPLPWSRPA